MGWPFGLGMVADPLGVGIAPRNVMSRVGPLIRGIVSMRRSGARLDAGDNSVNAPVWQYPLSYKECRV